MMDFGSLLLFLLPILGIYFLFFYKSRESLMMEKIPGPWNFPIIGIIFTFLNLPNEKIIPLFQDWYDQYGTGRVFKFWLFNKLYLCIGSPKFAEKVLSSTIHIDKNNDYDMMKSWLGEGLLTSKGSTWTHARKLLTPTFHFKILNDYTGVFNEESKKFIKILKDDFRHGQTFDIAPFLTRLTLDIICETAMGKTLNSQSERENPFLKATHDLTSVLNERMMTPWLENNFIWKRTKLYKKEQECLRIVHGFTDEVIRDRKAAFKTAKLEKEKSEIVKEADEEYYGSSGKKRLVFMDLLLEAQEQGQMNDIEIRDHTSTFIFGGHDTSSVNMGWLIYLIGRHPKIQEKLHQELDDIFGGDKEKAVTQNDIPRLKYLELCIKESLRLYPSAPFNGRKLNTDLEIEKGITIPANTEVLIQLFFIHRDPEHFPNPEVFDPERFTQENSAGRHPYAYIPFSAGPRGCIGQKFAMLEEKIVLANFFRNFRVESIEKPEDLILMTELILRPKNGINVKIFPRD